MARTQARRSRRLSVPIVSAIVLTALCVAGFAFQASEAPQPQRNGGHPVASSAESARVTATSIGKAPELNSRTSVDMRVQVRVFDETERPLDNCYAFSAASDRIVCFAPLVAESVARSGSTNQLLLPIDSGQIFVIWREGYVPRNISLAGPEGKSVTLVLAHELILSVRTDAGEPVPGYAIAMARRQIPSDLIGRLKDEKRDGYWLWLDGDRGREMEQGACIGISDVSGQVRIQHMEKGRYFLYPNVTGLPYLLKPHIVDNEDRLIAVDVPCQPIGITLRELFGVCVTFPQGDAITADFDWATRPFDSIDYTDGQLVRAWQQQLKSLAGNGGCVAVGVPRRSQTKVSIVSFSRAAGWWSFEEALAPVSSIRAATPRTPPTGSYEHPTCDVAITATRDGSVYRPFQGMRVDLWCDIPSGKRARLESAIGSSVTLPFGHYKVTMSGPPGGMFARHDFECGPETRLLDLEVRDHYQSLRIDVHDGLGFRPRYCGIGYYDGRGHSVQTMCGDKVRLWVRSGMSGLEPQEISVFVQGHERLLLDAAASQYRPQEDGYVLEALLR